MRSKRCRKVIKNKISDDAHIDAYLDRGFLAASRKHNKANKRNTITKVIILLHII